MDIVLDKSQQKEALGKFGFFKSRFNSELRSLVSGAQFLKSDKDEVLQKVESNKGYVTFNNNSASSNIVEFHPGYYIGSVYDSKTGKVNIVPNTIYRKKDPNIDDAFAELEAINMTGSIFTKSDLQKKVAVNEVQEVKQAYNDFDLVVSSNPPSDSSAKRSAAAMKGGKTNGKGRVNVVTAAATILLTAFSLVLGVIAFIALSYPTHYPGSSYLGGSEGRKIKKDFENSRSSDKDNALEKIKDEEKQAKQKAIDDKSNQLAEQKIAEEEKSHNFEQEKLQKEKEDSNSEDNQVKVDHRNKVTPNTSVIVDSAQRVDQNEKVVTRD